MTLEKIGNKTINEIAKKIFEIVQNEESIYDCFGIRWDTAVYAEGDILPKSHQLYQDQAYDCDDNPIYPEGEGRYAGYYDAGELNGTCSIGIDFYDTVDVIAKKIAESLSYAFDDHCKLYFIQGLDAEGGNDIDELIIVNATARVAF